LTDIRTILQETLADLTAANVPDDLRPVAFETILIARLREDTGRASDPTVSKPLQLLAGGHDGDDFAPAPPMESIAQRLGLDIETVKEVFNVTTEGEIELVVPAAKLPAASAIATKDIALLVAAARQAGGGEEWTPFGAIRTVADDYRRLDSSNFATTIQDMKNFFAIRSSSPRKKEVRMTRPAWERASALVRELAGSSS
jgi:hypothetical protein